MLLFFVDKSRKWFFEGSRQLQFDFSNCSKKLPVHNNDQALVILCVTFRSRDFYRFDGNRERACRIQMRVPVFFREPDSWRLSFFNSRRLKCSCFVVHHKLDNWRVGRLSSSGGNVRFILRMKFAFLVFVFWVRFRGRSNLPNCHAGSCFFFWCRKKMFFIRGRRLQPFYFTRRFYGFAWSRNSKSSFTFFELVLDFWFWQFQNRLQWSFLSSENKFCYFTGNRKFKIQRFNSSRIKMWI